MVAKPMHLNPVSIADEINRAVADGIAEARNSELETQSGTAYTLDTGDEGKTIEFTNASAVTVTVPTNATAAFALGATVRIRQIGAGKVTLAPAGGVTLRSAGGLLSTGAQYADIELTKRATNEWVVTGNRIA